MRSSPRERIAELTGQGLWEQHTLHGLLAEQAGRVPDKLAVKDQPNRDALTGDTALALSWSELGAASVNLAAQLRAAGIGADTPVVIQLPNVVELVVAYYALSRLGAIISPVPVQYGAHELRDVSAVLDARFIISLPRLGDQALAETARAAVPSARVLEFGRDLQIDLTPVDFADPVARDPNNILSVCWTSGTTGTPKGVPRSHNMWVASARCSVRAGSMVADDVLLNPFPLVNMAALGGFLFPAALLGATLILHHPLDPGLFLQQMQNDKATFTIAPPALLNQLAKAPQMWEQFDFSSLRSIGSGSAPLAPSMIETFGRDYGKEVINFYGSNEGICLFATPEDAPEPEVRAAMFRRPGQGELIETRLADPDTGEVINTPGVAGELLISGATVFDGYFAHDNQDVFAADGYFRSGDLVEICGQDNNFYRIVGRCKDIINRGGMKISPAELDVALEHHPALAEAAVCAYPDERLGERICACLVLDAAAVAPELDELQAWLLDKGFARFKLPERIELLAALPRNPLGKVQRFALQQTLAEQQETKA